MEKYYKDTEIAEMVGVHSATIWKWAARGDFPKPIKLANRCTRWKESDVKTWLAERAEAVQ